MKTSQQCPKCASQEIVYVQGSKMTSHTVLPLPTKWSAAMAAIDRYVCFDCGFIEEYIRLEEKVRQWRKKQQGSASQQ